MSKNKAKGTAWESSVVAYLRDRGWPYAERRALAGGKDLGDVTGIPRIVFECKNAAAIELAQWLDEANEERINAKADLGVVWFKRRGRGSPGDSYVLMDGETFTNLLHEAGY